MKRGVAFLHLETPARDPLFQRALAEKMVASARENVKDAYIVQMTDMTTPGLAVDEVRRLEPFNPYFMSYRLKHLALMEYEALILDSDTLILQDPSSAWDTEFDVCLTFRKKRIVSPSIGYTESDPLMAFNTGVMFSRSQQFWKDAFAICEKLEDRHRHWYGDQIAVTKMVENGKYNVSVLPCAEWNYTPASEDEDLSGKMIAHFKGWKKKRWMLKYGVPVAEAA